MEVILVIKSHLNLFRTGIASTNYKSDMLLIKHKALI